MSRSLRFLLPCATVAVLALAGCGDDVTTPRYGDPQAVEPTAGDWRTWVIENGSEFRPDAPANVNSVAAKNELAELRDLAAARTPEIEASIDFWNGGNVRRWNETHRKLIRDVKPNPPRAARGLALVSVAMYDAMVAAWDAKYFYERPRPFQLENGPAIYGTEPKSPSYVSERAAIGAAAADVLKYLFPTKADSIESVLQQAMNADLYSGVHFRSDVEAGLEIGHAVAAEVLQWAHTDNSTNTIPPVAQPVGNGYWVPTAPGNVQNPLEPGAGAWQTWVLPNGHAIRPPAPPAYDSNEFRSQLREVWDVYNDLPTNPERLEIARFWADGPGTNTPPGHWNQIAVDLGVSRGMNEPRMARMLALLGAAQHDAFVACWDCKYSYWCVRPITEIRKTYDPAWLSPVTTPPFPSFPSGHSTTSGAASTLLGYIFPDDAVMLGRLGTEAMNSRLYGGIHFGFDNLIGFNLGSAIGYRTIAHGASDGSPQD